MTIEVGPELQAMIEAKMRAGRCKTVEELLMVGLTMIDWHDQDVDDMVREIGSENLRQIIGEAREGGPTHTPEEMRAALEDFKRLHEADPDAAAAYLRGQGEARHHRDLVGAGQVQP